MAAHPHMSRGQRWNCSALRGRARLPERARDSLILFEQLLALAHLLGAHVHALAQLAALATPTPPPDALAAAEVKNNWLCQKASSATMPAAQQFPTGVNW